MNVTRAARLGSWFSVGAVALWSAACASSGAAPRPFPVPGGASAHRAPAAVPAVPGDPAVPPDPAAAAVPEETSTRAAATFDGYALAGTALGLRGIPYRNGGGNPNGFDC